MNAVGYLKKYDDRLEGERGMYYDYILAGNGIWVEHEGPFMAARVPVALCEVRGLAPLEPKVVLRYGKIPQHLFDLALNTFETDKEKERYAAITWAKPPHPSLGNYHIHVPEQEVTGTSIEYKTLDDVVLDLHSHGTMDAFFSGESCYQKCNGCEKEFCDQRDERGFRLYGVVGKLGETPVVKLRVGVYGYFHIIPWSDVFEGSLTRAIDFTEVEEVTDEDELPCEDGGHAGQRESHGGWLRWNRWFRSRGLMPASGKR